MTSAIPFNVQILPWAVSRAGYDLQEFAQKYPKLHFLEWLQNTKQPTLKQLQNFSKKVHLPFGYLFLAEPPKEITPFLFFRTGTGAKSTLSPNVYDTVQILQRRQDWLRNYLIESEEASPLPYVGKFDSNSSVSDVVLDIRKTLILPEDWNTFCPNKDATRKFLVNKAEEAGIVVVLNGVVENNIYRTIPVEECRGFVMVDNYVPFLFINVADAPAAQIFTLAHEIAHIWLGKSAGFDLSTLLPADDPVELFCNAVAAELLVPEIQFRNEYRRGSDFSRLANHFKVSRLVIARRAFDLGFIDRQSYIYYFQQVQQAWIEKKQATEGGGDFYNTSAGRISKRFAGYIDRAVKKGDLLYRDAYRLTGLTAKTYPKFLESLQS